MILRSVKKLYLYLETELETVVSALVYGLDKLQLLVILLLQSREDTMVIL